MTDGSVDTLQFRASNSIQTTSLVAYQSRGHCLIIAPIEIGVEVAARLNTPGKTLFVPTDADDGIDKKSTEDGLTVIRAKLLDLHGYLGAFDCSIGEKNSPGSLAKVAGVSLLGGFDLVLDLSEQPVLDVDVLPFGYLAPGTDNTSIDAAMEQLLELQGDFEKPRYFEYDASICAHSRSGITACTNCIDVCGTGAISTNGDGVAIEPYLCQGCGSCSSSCPSGAVRYAYPAPADAMSQLAGLLAEHRAKGSAQTLVFLHDAENGAERLQQFEADLADTILPLAVEEVASIGIDGWFCALAYGAALVVIDAPSENSAMRRGLADQLRIANEILAGIGLVDRLRLLEVEDASSLNALAGESWSSGPVASFSTHNNKRQTTRLALDHLREHATVFAGEAVTINDTVALWPGAPFGEVVVNPDTCTLCLACVTVCPARALQDGETLPQLKFLETNCLQCGMCEQACPENAISLMPRFLYDSETALKPRIVNEEAPFNCVVCNTPFATQAIIGRMQSKLAGHWMFGDNKALRRLKMCEDCRVKDIFEDESGIDVHKT
ncbi:hypothetical protein AB833_23330 [Chromatiales bacterium (ex Bugula neritina AB1)]|nr:hypothetical protein AB833_23330 [Chromatiales bacterium (ex Bugula neritina AB1)]